MGHAFDDGVGVGDGEDEAEDEDEAVSGAVADCSGTRIVSAWLTPPTLPCP